MSKEERAKTARKKKREGSKGKQFVANTKKATVKAAGGGEIKGSRRLNKGCGAVMEDRRKRTLYA